MSLGQIRMCSRPRVGMFFFPLTTGGVGPVATSQPRRPVIRNLMPRCAPSTIPDEWNGLTSAQRDPFEESFSQAVDADNVEHRFLAHRRSGRLSPTFTLAGPGIGSRGALLTSPIQPKNACLSVVAIQGDIPKARAIPAADIRHDPKTSPMRPFAASVAAIQPCQDRAGSAWPNACAVSSQIP